MRAGSEAKVSKWVETSGQAHLHRSGAPRSVQKSMTSASTSPPSPSVPVFGDESMCMDEEDDKLFHVNRTDFTDRPQFMRAVRHFDASAKPPRSSRRKTVQRGGAAPQPRAPSHQPFMPEVDDLSVEPSLITCDGDDDDEGIHLSEMQEYVYEHFAGRQLGSHMSKRPVQPIFVGANVDSSGRFAAYAIYTGPRDPHNSVQLIGDADRMPAHMTRRAPLSLPALKRRAELRGMITALEILLQPPLQPVRANVCVSSAYVVKAWGVWIPQWEAHGWPGDDVDTRSRQMPLTRHLQHLSMDTSSDSVSRRSDSLGGVSSGVRRPSRRLVDEDLLRDLAGLRMHFANMEKRGGPRVYLYQIDAQHNPAESMVAGCILTNASPVEPDMQEESEPEMRGYQPMRIVSPPRHPTHESLSPQQVRRHASPLPDDVFLNSPSMQSSMLRRSPKSPSLSWASLPHARASSPRMTPSSPSLMMYSSPKMLSAQPQSSPLVPPPAPLPVPMPVASVSPSPGQSSAILQTLSPSPAAESYLSPASPLVPPRASTPQPLTNSPATPTQGDTTFDHSSVAAASVEHSDTSSSKKLTTQALREHDRQTGATSNSPLWRRARSARMSTKSESVHSILYRLTPKLFRKNKTQPNSPDDSFSFRPPLRATASQPSLRRAAQEFKAEKNAEMPPLRFVEPASVSSADRSAEIERKEPERKETDRMETEREVVERKGVENQEDVQRQAREIARQQEELRQREETLARQEVDMMRRRFDMENKRGALPTMIKYQAHSDSDNNDGGDNYTDHEHDYTAAADDSDWLWESNFRPAPRLQDQLLPPRTENAVSLPSSSRDMGRSLPTSRASPFTPNKRSAHTKASPVPTRGAQWRMYEESRQQRQPLPRKPSKDALGLYLDGDGFGSSAALPHTSPYFRNAVRKQSSAFYDSSESEDNRSFP